MNEIKKKKKSPLEKKNPVSHQKWLDYKKQRNLAQYEQRKNSIKLITDNNFLTKCSFCFLHKIKNNRNFYIHNRNKVNFWSEKYQNLDLICNDCLFDRREIEINENALDVYKEYKKRYFNKE